MATTTSNTNLKQIKASPAERVNGKIKIQTKADVNANAPANAAANGSAKGPGEQHTAALSPEQRRRVSGRPQMTTEEQRQALRKRVEQFIPTIPVRNSTTNILAKYKDATPSLVVHLHPTHFRFDQQDGVFSYNSPMKAFLEHIRDEQIPPDVADVFKLARIKYYDACLIVEVRDHRPLGPPASATTRGGPFITPSQNTTSGPAPPPAATSKDPPRVYKTLLRPTEQSLWQDFGQLADTSGGEFTDWMGLQVEGGLMLAMHPRLVLDTPRPGITRKRIFEQVCDQTSGIPPRKKVKRESSKAADDSAERAAEEKLMLLGDLKHDRDFQPRFQYLIHKEEFKKKKAEEEKAKAANGSQGRDFGSMLTAVNDAPEVNRNKPKAVTIESIQAQQAQQQAQQAHMQARLPQVPTPGANPAQLAQQAAQQSALAAAQAQQNQQQAMQNHQAQQQAQQRRVPLPRVASQDQLQQQRPQQQPPNLARPLQPTGAASNTPTPMSSSPQVPIQRLPATPRNVPGTPRPPGTPQPQPAKHPTPQANGQAMTPASTQPSPMLKSASQTDEGQMQQMNGARPQFVRAHQQQMPNGVPQQRPGPQLPLAIPQFLEVLKQTGLGISYEQYLSLNPDGQAAVAAKVQSLVQQRLAAQAAQGGNQATMRAFQQAHTFMQQAQNQAVKPGMPIQPGQEMTPEQQRIFAQNRQQFPGGVDPELVRQQIAAQQGRNVAPAEVQAMFQQQLLARHQAAHAVQQAQQQQQQQQNAQQQTPQQLAQQRQMNIAAQQAAQQAAAQGAKLPNLPNGQQMTPQQVQMYRARQIHSQQARAQQLNQQNAATHGHLPMQQFMNALTQEQKIHFQSLDGNSQNQLFTNWMQRQSAPQLQYNPMAAQNMNGRIPNPMMAQGQGAPNGAMMRQSTSGGGA